MRLPWSDTLMSRRFTETELGTRSTPSLWHGWGFYNLNGGRVADKILLVIAYHITHKRVPTRASVSQIMEIGATTKLTAIRLRHLDRVHERDRKPHETFQRKVTATRAETRGYGERQTALEKTCGKGRTSNDRSQCRS